MREKTKQALASWQIEAAKLKAERESNPNAFTTNEFAELAGVNRRTANDHLNEKMRKGKYRRTKKIVNGKLVPAWVEV